MKINKELVEVYKEITQGEGNETQLNVILAIEINKMAQKMKDDITISQMNRLEKVTNDLIKKFISESFERIKKSLNYEKNILTNLSLSNWKFLYFNLP